MLCNSDNIYVIDWERPNNTKLIFDVCTFLLCNPNAGGLQFVVANVVGECFTYRPIGEQQTTLRPPIRGSPPAFGAGSNISSNSCTNSSNSCTNSSCSNDSGSPKSSSMRGSGWEDKVPRPGEAVCATFPYLLVSIGSGVSVIRVDGPDGQHQRVSGSSIGGGTFYGLAKLLVGAGAPPQQQRSSAEHLRDAVASAAQAAVNSTTSSSSSAASNSSSSSSSSNSQSPSFEELLELAKRGDARKCDMMVGDIYGHDYQKIGEWYLYSSYFFRLLHVSSEFSRSSLNHS